MGARVADTQALEWPRSGVRKPDTYTNLYGLSFPNRLVADYYLDTEIPDRVKHAQSSPWLFISITTEDGTWIFLGLEDFASVNIGNLNVSLPDFMGLWALIGFHQSLTTI